MQRKFFISCPVDVYSKLFLRFQSLNIEKEEDRFKSLIAQLKN